MFKRKILKLVADFKQLTPTMQGLVILAILLILGILIRWRYIIEEVQHGFNFFNK